MPSDVQDVRALWVNPAGLGVRPEASVYFDVTVANPGASGRLGQFNLGFNSHGLGFGYQRDQFVGGVSGSTFRLGLGAGAQKIAAGFAAALYRGNTKGTGWDLGGLYMPTPELSFAGVIGNLGQPSVRGLPQRVKYTAGGTLVPVDFLALSATATANTSGMQGYGLAARAGWGTRPQFSLLARLDTDQRLRRTQFALGFSIGGAERVGLVATTPGDVSSLDNLTLYGVSTHTPQRSH